MDCRQFHEQLDDYVDGALDAGQQETVQQHAAHCPACHQALELQQALMQSLETMPVPPLRSGFAQAALKRAVASQQHHRRGFATGFGSALVAGLALWVMVAVWIPDDAVVEGEVSQVMLSLHQQSTVNLVFNTPKSLEDAKITILLPDHLELAGYTGQREVVWMTALSKGKNILPLPLKANAPVADHLLASIEAGGNKKTFRLKIEVSASGKTGLKMIPADMA